MNVENSFTHLTIGVLALQGAFNKHVEKIYSLGANTIEVRHPEELKQCQGLIIPGGESTTLVKQLKKKEWLSSLGEFALNSPIFATCAGLIILSEKVLDYPELSILPIFPIAIKRNAYGRQIQSFTTPLTIDNEHSPFPAIFIRAPQIIQWDKKIHTHISYLETPQLISYQHHIGATFHPELSLDTRIHTLFLKRSLNTLKQLQI